jgi:hypothetical protein
LPPRDDTPPFSCRHCFRRFSSRDIDIADYFAALADYFLFDSSLFIAALIAFRHYDSEFSCSHTLQWPLPAMPHATATQPATPAEASQLRSAAIAMP